MSFPSSTTVLVVGAGPAGMACALSLWYSGVKDITIVDAVHQDDHTSRAIVIHAATLEALDTIGCADEIVNRGITTTSIDYFDRNNNLLLGADFNGLIGKTRFPFYILLPQHITEEILGNKLKEVGIPIFRPYKAVGMHQSSKASGAADVSFENGESITAKYVIGADGIHSPIRKECGIAFLDPGSSSGKPDEANSMAQMIIADVTFSEPPPMPKILYGVVSTESFFVCCPLVYPVKNSKDSQGKTVYRLASGVPLSSGAPPSKPSVEYCQDLLEKYGPHSFSRDRKNKNAKTVSVSDVVWSTRFLTRYAVAETFFTYFGGDGPSSGASVCLIGDAAHIHPPAGGQGMNLGLRDAISVGPVIAASLTAGRSQESDEKVRKHMEARRQSALKVIKMTKIMAGAVGMSPAFQAKFAWSPIHIYTIRDWVFWAVSKSQWIRERLAFQFSGLASP